MAQVCGNMVSDEDSPLKCREARRRRMEMRRISSVVGTALSSPVKTKEKGLENPDHSIVPKRKRKVEMVESTSSSSSGEPESADASPSALCQVPVIDIVPIFGSMSVSGRSREMEDEISVRPNLCRPEISGGRPVHFFGVYDGHGGPHVATLCKEKMHVFLEEELMRTTNEASSAATQLDVEVQPQERWRSVMHRCFERMDEVALSACACGSIGGPCGCDRAGLTSEIVGSTAVVSVLTPDRILVANCGDSRAVLSRGGRAIPLSSDHKPDRSDELARIEVAGGRVIYLNGARVLGILAMSRALGDKYLKPIVISEPEVSFTERTPEDECLILASDGLWDVLSNEMACDVARRCLLEGSPSATIRVSSTENTKGNAAEQVCQSQTCCSRAAALLTRLALGRKSADNISVIVINLKRV